MTTYLFIQNRNTHEYASVDIDGTYSDEESAIIAVFSKHKPLEPDLLESVPLKDMIQELENEGVYVGFTKWVVFSSDKLEKQMIRIGEPEKVDFDDGEVYCLEDTPVDESVDKLLQEELGEDWENEL